MVMQKIHMSGKYCSKRFSIDDLIICGGHTPNRLWEGTGLRVCGERWDV